MDALTFYIGEAEAALTKRPTRRSPSPTTVALLHEHIDRLETAIRGITTAFDAENEEND